MSKKKHLEYKNYNEFANDLKKWASISKNLSVWDYTTNYSHLNGPFPNFGVLQANMQFFVESNTVRHYLFTAENDRIVHRSNAVDLDQMLKEKGNHSQILDVPKTGHLTVMGSVSTLFSRYFQTRKMIMDVLTELRQMD